MKPIAFVLFAALAGATAHAHAQESVTFEGSEGPVTVRSVQPPLANAADYQVKLADIDANRDGVVTRKEVPTDHALYFEFKLVDTDGNGRITEEELANWK